MESNFYKNTSEEEYIIIKEKNDNSEYPVKIEGLNKEK